ncbi:MAG TPA: PIG-L family deacetylase, partial [Vicinamibacteria bacterium]|nr:PIG-L family deacetylase [Vicinamibacteria bacterium]
MTRRTVRTALVLVVALGLGPWLGGAQLPIAQDRGSTGLGLALRRLGVTARVLYVTAHPDDEHNGVLVRLRRGLGLRTALLTLTRGEGGQNAIGPELGDALGVLRTEELAAVHRWDGAEQFFGRAYEFGYSFSVEESLSRWGREETLGDVVRVIRAFRPDVILTLPLEAKGGGMHHQAAALLARDAFRVAADPGRFPEHLAAGLPPWQARKIYQGGTGGFAEPLTGTPLVVKTGRLDPLLGLSWQAMGTLARASHRCQGASQLLAPPNAGEGRYALVDSEPPVATAEADLLDGVDASLLGLLHFAESEPTRAALAGDLDALQQAFDAARTAFDPEVPSRALPGLAAALAQLRRLRERAASGAFGQAGRFDLLSRLQDQEQALLAALPLAQGLELEALADDAEVVPGQTLTVTVSVANQGPAALTVENLILSVPNGWSSRATSAAPAEVAPGATARLAFTVTVSPDARPSGPYWRRVEAGDRYLLDRPEEESLPWSPPPVLARLRYAVAGTSAQFEIPAGVRFEGRLVGGERW